MIFLEIYQFFIHNKHLDFVLKDLFSLAALTININVFILTCLLD